jgi:hypothetical protein
MFVRIRVAVGPPYQALLVPRRAIGTDQDVKFVFVLDARNKVVRRTVQLGREQDGLQVATKGLGPKDRVIVNALQRVRQGMVVKPNLVPMPIPSKEALVQTPPKMVKRPAPPQTKR